jgi:hypothetical protein
MARIYWCAESNKVIEPYLDGILSDLIGFNSHLISPMTAKFTQPLWPLLVATLLVLVSLYGGGIPSTHANAAVVDDCSAAAGQLTRNWPNTDFSRCTVDPGEVVSGGPGKDGIPSIDEPQFVPATKVTLDDREPVITLVLGDTAKAYPLRVLTWHEIVNDTMGDIPVAVTYCPLCNAAIVFDRRVGNKVLDFGTTGSLRHSDLLMYDRLSQSWWQQYTGQAIFGEFAGAALTMLPSRLASFLDFKNDYPKGEVLVPGNPNLRPYGANPYVGYDSSGFPFLYRGEVPEGIGPLERVVVVDDRAWSLALLQQDKQIRDGNLVLTWRPGQASALDTREIKNGREVGSVTAQHLAANGALEDVVYHVTFAFVFHAFKPDQPIIVE